MNVCGEPTNRLGAANLRARTKLNRAFINGAVLVAAIAGACLRSWTVFWLMVICGVALAIYSGDIRLDDGNRRSPR